MKKDIDKEIIEHRIKFLTFLGEGNIIKILEKIKNEKK